MMGSWAARGRLERGTARELHAQMRLLMQMVVVLSSVVQCVFCKAHRHFLHMQISDNGASGPFQWQIKAHGGQRS
ncbi:hypothetical protein CD175_04995 [Pseudomonas laurylsulfatiphila]|uniref:Uncharacterized protein n=1 Tax=Pseudomonas laurylsulfatiphila TaxID=2011015 RepID=A0A2S6FTH1_9PSED|nr:hypothetical protein CD175_04995 [Pseudomonas laurylsulfatiphila]